MANKIISELTAVASVAANDLMEVQKSGETTTKKATVSQVLATESTARIAQDNVIETGVGLNADGTFAELPNSWFLRAADFVAGLTDRSGVVAPLTQSISNALRILDYKISMISGIPAQYWSRDTDNDILYPTNELDEVRALSAAFGVVGSNTFNVNGSGRLTLYGDAQYITALVHPVLLVDAARVSTWNGNLKILTFDDFTDESYHFIVQIPQSYIVDADLIPVVKWLPMSSAAGATRVRWGLEYFWQDSGVTGSATTTIYTNAISPVQNPVGYRQYASAFDVIRETHQVGSVLHCRLFRDAKHADDTLVGDAGAMVVEFKHLNNTLGTY